MPLFILQLDIHRLLTKNCLSTDNNSEHCGRKGGNNCINKIHIHIIFKYHSRTIITSS